VHPRRVRSGIYPVLAAAITATILPIYRIDPYRLNESQIPFYM
jgi:hypothetical protein